MPDDPTAQQAASSDLDAIERDAVAAVERSQSSVEIDAARVEHLGRSSALTSVLRGLRDLPADERSRIGGMANELRERLEARLETRRIAIERAELDARLVEERLDVTLPGRAFPSATLHVLTQTRRAIEDVFVGMGYRVADGPEVERAYYNFTALNTPDGHPARSASDSFYIGGDEGEDDVLLRTHTSPVQIRVMESTPPPVYVVIPGRVYRRDRIDATHGAMFHQLEGLAVDEGLTLADLKGTLETFARAIFGHDREIRLRTHFFPFTEPSVEVDVSCFACDASGLRAGDTCRLCKGVGWIEILGAGMVDPNVFGWVEGYDPAEVTGFAFGMGLDRIAMLRHGITDVRMLVENDLRFLAQFPSTPRRAARAR